MNLFAQVRRELAAFFYSPIAYVLLTAAALVNGWAFLLIVEFLSNPQSPHGAAMRMLFGETIFFWLLVIASASFITMRLVAEEKRSGTIETLLTAPINEAQVVVAKFLAAFVFYAVMWAPSAIYPIILSRYSEIELGPVLSGYLGTLGLGMVLMALGVFCSSLTRNQIIAALLTFGGNMALFLLGIFAFVRPEGQTDSVFAYLNVFNHMDDFSRGIVDTRHLVFYASTTVFVLFATVQVLQARRWKA